MPFDARDQLEVRPRALEPGGELADPSQVPSLGRLAEQLVGGVGAAIAEAVGAVGVAREADRAGDGGDGHARTGCGSCRCG